MKTLNVNRIMEEERKQQDKEERNYRSPDFEVVEIEFEQNILQGGSGSGDSPDFGGEYW